MTGSGGTETVLFVSLPAGRGGSVQSLFTVLAGLEGQCRRVVARPPGTAVAGHLDAEGLSDLTLDLLGVGRRAARVRVSLGLARWCVMNRRGLAAVHANGLSELLVTLLAGCLSRVPIVVWVHDWQVSTGQRRLARLAGRLTPIRWSTVSEANRVLLDADGITRGAAVRVVPNPVEPAGEDTIAVDGRGDGQLPTVVYVGAPASYKGFDLLPAVVDRVAALAPQARWEIWSGPRHQHPATFAALAERRTTVTVHDKTADVSSAYRRADVVFCPSRSESFGRVAAEALAHGRAVVASDLPALREVVGDAGVLVSPGDVDEAAAAIVALLDDPERRARLGREGRVQVARFAPATVVRDLVSMYRVGPEARRALVVSHEASRSGAPTVALDVVGALAASGWEVTVGLRSPGPLVAAFGQDGRRVEVEPFPRLRAHLRRRFRFRPTLDRLDERLAGRAIDRVRPDLVWANSTLSANYVRPARARGARVVVHVHELGDVVPKILSRYDLPAATRDDPAVRWVGASAEAAERLTELGVSNSPVLVLESSIDVGSIQRRGAGAAGPATPHSPPRTALVGACGRTGHDKGTDLWLEMAVHVHAERPATRFIWIGPDRPDDHARARSLGLGAAVHFTGELDDPTPLLAQLDVFTLPSRTDTFPLVVLEAMALGRPVVAFEAGGAPNQLGSAGVLVPVDDVAAFARAVIDLLDEPGRRADLGAAAQERVAAEFDLTGFRRRFGEIIAEVAP